MAKFTVQFFSPFHLLLHTLILPKFIVLKKAPKIFLLLLVLAPSIFFSSQAFVGNTAAIENGKLKVTGPGKFVLALEDIETLEWIQELPKLSGTGGFSLGWVKKGNFIRKSDQKSVRIIKNEATRFIHLTTEKMEFYFNLDNAEATDKVYRQLSENL